MSASGERQQSGRGQRHRGSGRGGAARGGAARGGAARGGAARGGAARGGAASGGRQHHNSSQSSRYVSTFPPDVVRYFKVSKAADRIQTSADISYDDNNGDTTLVIEGDPTSITAAVNELQREAGCVARSSQSFSIEALTSFRSINHFEIVQALRNAKAFAGWHASLSECKLYTCGKDQTVAHRALASVSSLINEDAALTNVYAAHNAISNPRSPQHNQVMPRFNFSLSQSATSNMSPNPPIMAFTDRFEVALECLRYMKTVRANTISGVMININTQTSCIEVSGDRRQVFETIEDLHRRVDSLTTQNIPKSAEFLDCLKSVKNKVVIEAFRAAQVKAGWDIRDKKLWMCSDSGPSVGKAEEAISGLIMSGEFPDNGSLTTAQMNLMCDSEWKALTENLKETYPSLELGCDTKRARISFAAADKSARISVTNALDKFFRTRTARTTARIVFDPSEGAVFAARSKSLERDIQKKDGEQVQMSLSTGGFDLTSTCSKSLRYAEGILRRKIKHVVTQDVKVKRPAQCDWIDSNEGKKRLKEICTLTKTIHTMVVTRPRAQRKSLNLNTDGSAAKFDLVIGDISQIFWEVDGVFSSQGTVGESLQKVFSTPHKLSKGIQSFKTTPTGKSKHIYHTVMAHKSEDPTYLMNIGTKVEESLKEFAKLGATSIAFPAIGTGNLRYSPSRVAAQMMSTCSEYFQKNPQSTIKKIIFVTYWTDDVVHQEFKKLLDMREKHASASSLPPSSPRTHKNIVVRFSGLGASDVNDAVTRLQSELKSKLIKDDWSSSPLRNNISKLTVEQKARLTVKAEERDVEIKITTDNIVIEGSNEDVKVLRHEINGILHTSEGAVGKLPIHWAVMKTGYAEIKLDPFIDAPEYRKVTTAFYATLQTVGVTVTEITRIQNELLYTQYEAQKMKVSNELQLDSVVIERSLWHGTDVTTIRQICTNEFNRSFAGKNATAYGQGSYFATTSNYSLKYAQGYMILAKVATGRYYRGSSSVDRTKLKPGYHSTVNDEANPSIFVVYHDAAAYPEYVIKFSRLGYGY